MSITNNYTMYYTNNYNVLAYNKLMTQLEIYPHW